MRDNDQLDMSASDAVMDSVRIVRTQFYVHYTVENPAGVKQYLKAGPYSEAEVLDQRRDIATYSGVTDAYVSESDQRVRD